ncbi:PLP-dependent aminotransferase family protein [Acetivibrio sp. MSJd-27]|uniref:aminotransferase-like domain-containing protein n=1 Tax=Acetivibrio sp. MSJd-27 TaxID=2841523 RepID=UPI001C0F8EFB|nr:PLP-dependent aminotransferase family protein [Acetivibrio sp. MSJd-27]MBU5450069.1 PLP-dependent aminotransferase family protein [Acetivibrio sp. MSJd-27]
MEYNFAGRMNGVKGSAIREMFKMMQKPGVISFAGGNPSPETFPVEELKEISQRLLTENPGLYLQYGITEGYAPLAEILSEQMKEKGILKQGDKLLITSGAQQAIDLAAKAILDKGDGLACETPSFIGALNAFRTYEAPLFGIELQPDGIDTKMLEDTLAANPNIKLLYIIPTFQNPSGITASEAKRREVLEICIRHNVLIIEDNPYGELRFAGEDVPTIKSMDESGEHVIYVGSLSKVLSPGLRIGFVVANEKICEKITVLKQVNDVHTNLLSQAMAYEWLKNYSFSEHVQEARALYGHKCSLMLKEMDETFPEYVTYTRPEGGLFIWCTIHKDVDSAKLVKPMIDQNVAFVPGCNFMTDIDAPTPFFRLNYSTSSDENIVKGIHLMAEALKNI